MGPTQEPVAHICLYIDGFGEIHLDIIDETDEPILDIVERAFIHCMTEIRKLDANPRSAPIGGLH